MHPLFRKADALTGQLIAAAIEVHRDKGPGLMETIYEWCLMRELEIRELASTQQKLVQVRYKGFVREEPLRFDLLVEDCVLIEVKAVQAVFPIHQAQLLSYMKLLDVPVGLLINFHEAKLTDGVSRLILPGSNRQPSVPSVPSCSTPPSMTKTLFQRIIDREIPAQLAHEDEHCVAIHDIHPQAPVHVLVIPKRPIARVGAATPDDQAVLGHLLLSAAAVARKLGLDASGYRLVVNNGRDGGETVPHLHVHLLGGRPLGWPPG